MRVRGHFHVGGDIWYFAEETLSRSLERRLRRDKDTVSDCSVEQSGEERYDVARDGGGKEEAVGDQYCMYGYIDLLGRFSSIILALIAPQEMGERRLYRQSTKESNAKREVRKSPAPRTYWIGA